MKNPNTTNGGASNSSFKSQDKNTKIFWFLKVVHHFEFSPAGIKNIAGRLSISPAHLSILIDFIRNRDNVQ